MELLLWTEGYLNHRAERSGSGDGSPMFAEDRNFGEGQDGQSFESKPPAPPKIVKEPGPIPARAPKSFTMGRL
jgi:hypothetical protein